MQIFGQPSADGKSRLDARLEEAFAIPGKRHLAQVIISEAIAQNKLFPRP